MRALPIRDDDTELLNAMADPEKYVFYLSHISAFKRMWEAEGTTYWLRFLLVFKSNYEQHQMRKSQYSIMFDLMEEEVIRNLVFINIHKKFVHSSYAVAKSFMEKVFTVIEYWNSVWEANRRKNPFYAKDTREAFRDLFGCPKIDEVIPFAPIAFLASIYGLFVGGICILLKRWLKEPDLSEEAENNVDYTHVYWRPSQDWDDCYNPSCFDKNIAATYNEDLPRMLLHANIHEIFRNHDFDCSCKMHKSDINVLELLNVEYFQSCDSVNSDSQTMQHVGYLDPKARLCNNHSDCYQKILHDPKCPEPYLCENSSSCELTCETKLKKQLSETQPKLFWKKGIVETFASKTKGKRHVATFAQSHCNKVETFLHAEKCSLNLNEEADDLSDFCVTPEMMNTFNQYKRKEDVRKRLKTKFVQKYCLNSEKFNDPDFCLGLFKKAEEQHLQNKLDELLHMHNNPFEYINGEKCSIDPLSTLNSLASAETTVAVGTHSILSGRIVLPSKAPPVIHKTLVVEPPLPPFESETVSKSKKSKSKKKKKKNAKSTTNPASAPDLVDNEKNVISNDISLKKDIISTNDSTGKENISELIYKSYCDKLVKLGKELPSNHKPEAIKAFFAKNCIMLDTFDTETNIDFQLKIIKVIESAANIEDQVMIDSDKPLSNNDELVKKKDSSASTANKVLEEVTDEVENSGQLCFGGCIPTLNVGPPIERRGSLAEADNKVQTEVITTKLKKNPKSKVNLKQEASDQTTSQTSDQLKANADQLETKTEVSVFDSRTEDNPKVKDGAVDPIDNEHCSGMLGFAELEVKVALDDSESVEDANSISQTDNTDNVRTEKHTKPPKSEVIIKQALSCQIVSQPVEKLESNAHQLETKAERHISVSDMQTKDNPKVKDGSKNLLHNDHNYSMSNAAELKAKLQLDNSEYVCGAHASTQTDNTEGVITTKSKVNLKQEASGQPFNETKANAHYYNLPSAAELEVKGIKSYSDFAEGYTESLYALGSKCVDGVHCSSQIDDTLLTKSKRRPKRKVNLIREASRQIAAQTGEHLKDKSAHLKAKSEKISSVQTDQVNDSTVNQNQINSDCDGLSEAAALEAKIALDNLKFDNEEDKPVENFLTLIGLLKSPLSSKSEPSDSCPSSVSQKCNNERDTKLKTCAFCGKKEVIPKSFKRCGKCKAENLPQQRYYCSRECQVEDWQELHKNEH